VIHLWTAGADLRAHAIGDGKLEIVLSAVLPEDAVAGRHIELRLTLSLEQLDAIRAECQAGAGIDVEGL